MIKIYRILAINPGSTSTKISVYQNENEIFFESIIHSEHELHSFQKLSDQYTFRLQIIENSLRAQSSDLETLDCVVGRGGLLRPIPGGTYRVNEKMINDLKCSIRGEHASNLGGIIAYEIAKKQDIPAFIVDPVVVDEFEPVARLSGIPDLERQSIFHALNQKAVARRAARELGKTYEEVNFIVVHLGGGISVGAHSKGRVIDVNNAFNGDGPFAPERAGSLPSGQLVELCYSRKYSEEEMMKKLVGNGGIVAYLGTNDMRKVKKMIDSGNSRAELVYNAMIYQVAKEIGSMASVLRGKVEGIILTGGLANDLEFIQSIIDRISWISRIFVYPGGEETKSLALGALRVLRGEEKAKDYT